VSDLAMGAGVRPGTRLGIDVGSVRIGVASCDPSGRIASPVETVRRDRRGADIDRIVALAAELRVIEVVVGLPLSMSGARGAAADAAYDYARRLVCALGSVPVRLVDERLTTVSAHGNLATAGLRSRARRDIVDQEAAVIILQSALDAEHGSGAAPGELMTTEKGSMP
jgi:putative holliday junction resolvase